MSIVVASTIPAMLPASVQSALPKAEMHYGDLIRSQKLTVHEQLVRSGIAYEVTAFERLLVTANGNLQRIISSWLKRPVDVEVLRNVKHGTRDEWSRSVRLVCAGKGFCTANSSVELYESRLVEAVNSGHIGLGQLFRHFNLLPSFELLSASKSGGELIRKYTLSAPGILCTIEETLDMPELLSIEHSTTGSLPLPVSSSSTGADLMSGLRTKVPLESLRLPECSPFERVILTANGNIQRLTSSYLNSEVEVSIRQSCGEKGSYERKVVFRTLEGKKIFGQANSTILLTDPGLVKDLDAGKIDLGALFSSFYIDSLPEFELLNAERVKSETALEESKRMFSYCPVVERSLVRLYSLSTQYAALRIHEVFLPWLFGQK